MRNIRRFIYVLISLSLFLGAFSIDVKADDIAETDSDKKIYVIAANRLTLDHIDKMDHLKSMLDNSAVGLMNVRGATSYNNIEGFLTINSSSKTYGFQEMAKVHELKGEKRDLYELRMGDLDGEYAIGYLEYSRLKLYNEDRDYSPTIGALGENLKSSGKKRAVYGVTDKEEIERLGALIAIDSRGLVEYGNFEDSVVEDTKYPFNLRTNYDFILGDIERLKDDVSFTVIDAGDLDRLHWYGKYLQDDMFDYHRDNILADLDQFLYELSENIDENSTIMILSPNEGESRYEENKLTPLIIWNNDIQKSILYSGGTRTEGIVSNVDIGPTISSILGAKSDNYTGDTLEYRKNGDQLQKLKRISLEANFTFENRGSALYYHTILSIALLFVCLASMIFFKTRKGYISRYLSFFLVLMGAYPLFSMLFPLLNIQNVYAFYAFVIISSLIMSLFLCRLKSIRGMVVLYSLLFLTIVVDILLGGYLARTSVMGYSPIIGARYFGIGNETSGILLAITAIITSLSLKKWGRIALIIPFISFIIMAIPNLGANVGGSISFLALFIGMTVFTLNIRVDFKRFLAIIALFIVGITMAGIIDANINPSPTHFGRLVIRIQEGGLYPLFETIFRKLSVNMSLISKSIWGKALILTILLMGSLFFLAKEKFKDLVDGDRYIGVSIISVLIANTVGLLVNDSGVLLATFSNFYLLFFIVYYMLKKE